MARTLAVLVLLCVGAALSAALLTHRSEAATAAAPIQRTFVSTSGSDTNPCTRAEPCRNFVAALPNTLAGGEIVALDSGGYGPMTIDKAVSVIGAPGAHVAISAFSGVGITVDAGATDTVVLRNIYLTGLGGTTGISYTGGGRLHLEGVTAGGFSGSGVLATAGEGKLVVRDCVFRNNGANGLLVDAPTGKIEVQIQGSRADQNGNSGFEFTGNGTFDGGRGSIVESSATGNLWGFHALHGTLLSISDSTADDNAGGGVGVSDSARVSLNRMTLSSNNGAVRSFGGFITVGGSLMVSNGVGFWNQGGTMETWQDNLLRGNTFNSEGTVTNVAKG